MREGVFVAPKRAKRKEARGLVLLVARVLSVGLSLLVASAAIRASAGSDDPAPQGEPPVEEATEEVQSREQRMLRQAVFRDRTIQCALDGAESPCGSGEINRAVAQLQQVLDQPGDHFIWIRVRTSPGERSTAGRRSAERRRAAKRASFTIGCTQPKRSTCSSADSPRLTRCRGRGGSTLLPHRFWFRGDELARHAVARSRGVRVWRFARGGCLAADPYHRKRVNAGSVAKARRR